MNLNKKGKLVHPLDFLLTPKSMTGDFPRMYLTIANNLGQKVEIKSPHFNEIILNLHYTQIENDLVKNFADNFIKKLNLK